VLRTIGELHLADGSLSRAQEFLTQARDQFDALDLPLFRARAERDLAAVHERAGDPDAAGRFRDAALATFAALGSREHLELTNPVAAPTD
jgi:hypothetical protein